jgi:hypothetical protein
VSSGGLQTRTKAWLFAIRSYYASDPDIVALCEFTEELMEQGDERGTTTQETGSITCDDTGDDDEWSAGG